VFEPDYSGELERLAFRSPVWLIDTPANRTAAEQAALAAIEWPHITVTLFRHTDDWKNLLNQIALRERFESVDVIGCDLTERAREALLAAGFERIETMANGFRARR
jgi:RecB family exonuclease